MIGQSLINIKSGGRGRTWELLPPRPRYLHYGGRTGHRANTGLSPSRGHAHIIGTFEWSTFKTVGRVPHSEIFVILAVTLITVFMHNLALAVFVGVILSALVFAWESAQHVRLFPTDSKDGSRVYNLHGLLYFGSVREFAERLSPSDDPEEVIIDFKDARICDFSSLEMLSSVTERYKKAGKRVRLRHLSPECQKLFKDAGTLVEIEVADDDPQYRLARV